MKAVRTILTGVLVSAALCLPAMAVTSQSTVNKGIRIADNQEAGSVDSVNGSVTIGANAVVRSTDTVNGSIRIDEGAIVGSIESVNGSIRLAESVTVEADIESVNGGISIRSNSQVGGDIHTVNGSLEVEASKISGGITTVNGAIRLLDGTEVFGDLLVKEPKGWSIKKRKPVKVEIGANSVIHGDLIFEREVELKLHDTAKVGNIIGDVVNTLR